MGNLIFSESITIERPAESLYDLVSDITNMGQWSPVCKACWWDGDAGPKVGARFFGRNEMPERTWETRCEVVAAERGKTFAFEVGDSLVRWSYSFAPVDGGTELTESWELLPAGIALFERRYQDQAQALIENRIEAAQSGIPATLAAIKQTAEAT